MVVYLVGASVVLGGDEEYETTVGNGGTTIQDANAELSLGSIEAGGNSGDVIVMGNVSGSTIGIEGSEVSSPVEQNVSVNMGPQVADGSGGDATAANIEHGDVPENFDVNFDNTDDVSVENDSSSDSDSSSSSAGGNGGSGGRGGDATGGDGGSSGDANDG